MNIKQRSYASLSGQPVDRFPVTVLYNYLYFEDHFNELTGLPGWEMYRWLSSPPEGYLELFRKMISQAPFELLQVHQAPSRQEREDSEFFEQEGHLYLRDNRSGAVERLDTVSGHAKDYKASEVQRIFDRADIRSVIKVPTPQDLLDLGLNDYLDQVVRDFGKDHYIISGGVVGTIYGCGQYVGQQNLLAMLVDRPDFADELCARFTEQNLATIHQLTAAKGDAIYIDDATATREMISLKHYERFCLPYMKTLIDEIHRLGHQAIVIYFGGVEDRLEAIASTGADGLQFETRMKSYTNDIEDAARRVGKQVTLFGNIDPVSVLQDASDPELDAEIQRQLSAGRLGRGFILSTGSPITPGTPLQRVQKFLASVQEPAGYST